MVETDWTAVAVAARVARRVPRGVTVTAREDAFRQVVRVWLQGPWWLRWWRGWRRGVLVAAATAVADAPAGRFVRIEWR